MKPVKMNAFQTFMDFGASVVMPDSSSMSFLYYFAARPAGWLARKGKSLARIVGATGSFFAAFDLVYQVLAICLKAPFASKIQDNIENLKQSLGLLFTASKEGALHPEKLDGMAYPISEEKKTPIITYHDISTDIEDPWTISPELFEQHLETLYSRGYELCTLREFCSGYQPNQGKKLAVITFDDSHEGQFRVSGINKQGEVLIDPNCAIGIMEKAKAKHPDFRCVATFFVNTSQDRGTSGSKNHQLFADDSEQLNYISQKLRYLLDHGHEIGSHGHLHQRFDTLSSEDIQKDLQSFDSVMQNIKMKDLTIVSFAWPHGLHPYGKRRNIVEQRYPYIADYGWNSGKVSQEQLTENPKRLKKIPRIHIGPHTGFAQYFP